VEEEEGEATKGGGGGRRGRRRRRRRKIKLESWRTVIGRQAMGGAMEWGGIISEDEFNE